MRNRLPNNEKTKKYLESLRKVYFVGMWASWGCREFYFSGKFTELYGRYQPLVWVYDDHNGIDDAYYLRPIEFTTSGYMFAWTFDKYVADDIVKYKRNEKYLPPEDLWEVIWKSKWVSNETPEEN